MPPSTNIVLRRLTIRMKIHFSKKGLPWISENISELKKHLQFGKKNKQEVVTKKIYSCESYFACVPNNEPAKSLWYVNSSPTHILPHSLWYKVFFRRFYISYSSCSSQEGIHTSLQNAECSVHKNPLSKVKYIQGITFPTLFELGTSSSPACLLKHCKHQLCCEGG